MSVRFCSYALCLTLATLAACSKPAAPRRSLPVVQVGTVERRDVPVILHATGTVEPVQTAQVAAQVDGIIERVLFREGDEVRQGQALFQIDSRPYQAALAQAEAALARDLAMLQSAGRDAQRFEELAVKEYVTAQQLDQARTSQASLAATLRADSAAVMRARLDLDRASVRAPISGRAGSILVRPGNLVRAGSGTPLVVINQITPILVRFAVPATDLSAIRKATGVVPAIALPVGDTNAPQVGQLSFLDNAVDSLTGTIMLKATFPNVNRSLWPGGLVRVRLTLATDKGALVVPLSSILTGQQGNSIFVVGDSNKVKQHIVTVLRSTDSLAILAGGVEPGSTIVIDGQVRITDGSMVQVVKPDSGQGGSQ
jgi:multidrug efflux system membrane fusion protein